MPHPALKAPPFLRCIDVLELRFIRGRHLNNPRFKHFGQLAQREFPIFDLFGDNFRRASPEHEGKATVMTIGQKSSLLAQAEFSKEELNQLGRDRWHVASQKKNGIGLSRGECGINSSYRAAPPHHVSPDCPHGQSGFLGCRAHMA
jgi:hypothetical protein